MHENTADDLPVRLPVRHHCRALVFMAQSACHRTICGVLVSCFMRSAALNDPESGNGCAIEEGVSILARGAVPETHVSLGLLPYAGRSIAPLFSTRL